MLEVAPVVVVSLLSLVALVALSLASYLLMSHYRYVRIFGHSPAYQGGALVAYWLAELGSMVTLGAWTLAALGRNALRGPEGERPVLCVHGYVGNGTNWWGLRRALHQLGRPTAAVDLGHPPRPLEAYVPPLVEALLELSRRSPDGRVDVVAHSMGGLILRLATRDHPEVEDTLGTIVTLGSPHEGTDSPPAFVPHEGVQMRRGSAFLESLPDPSPGLLPRWRTVAAEQDYVVFPEETSKLPGAPHTVLPGIGHAGLLTSGVAHDAVFAALGLKV